MRELLDKKTKEYKAAKEGTAKIEATVKSISSKINEARIINLLGEKYEKPEFSEREKMLLELGRDETLKIAGKFRDKETKICPFCFRETDEDFKNDILESIKKVLNKGIEEHINCLNEEKHNLEKLKLEINGCIIVNSANNSDTSKSSGQDKLDIKSSEKLSTLPYYDECKKQLDEISAMVDSLIAKIEEKINQSYSPITDVKPGIIDRISDANKKLNELMREIDSYNEKALDADSIEKEIILLNYKITCKCIEEDYELWQRLNNERNDLKDKLSKNNKIIEYKKKEMEKLESEKSRLSEDIAVPIINKYLSFIFTSNDRLRIEYDKTTKKYKLYSRGEEISPKQASIGERNIIALCYFFTTLLSKKSKDEAYNDEYLLVIDDPISSFDIGNKVGLMSFIKMMLNTFVGNNKKTSIIITTHDIKSAFDIGTIYGELYNKYKPWNFSCLEIRNQKLVEFKDKRNEYTELLNTVYGYANKKPEAKLFELVIGNIMRQVLEAYATFTYGVGMAEISTNNYILENIDEKYREYFENNMYRLFLNGGSHKVQDIKALDDNAFFTKLDNDNKVKVARDVICLLYLLNSSHVMAHIRGKRTDNERRIKEWITSIN